MIGLQCSDSEGRLAKDVNPLRSIASSTPCKRWLGKLSKAVRAFSGRGAVACLCLLFAAAGWGQAKPSEYDVKAAYLFNFGRFMRVAGNKQPEHSSFDICILGRDPIGSAMDAMVANESIDGRPVHVMRVNDATAARSCEIVFVSSDEGEAIREDLALLDSADELTVSDAPDFLERGGMIQFVLQGDHVRFEVNLNAVNRTHVVLSSELLRVAAAVTGRPSGVQR